ncbi:RdgB/HAM1 family non-canonical purine NTP pyrophosphatase [Gluconobacter roseus]|uniref:dITP/XTP pyrophosphatase n=1 Tax=Gluconobacter roseus NBRC 3990 TaxID=1307950 RepID=A0A4Y3MCP1_9PROT|nr:RdgB/HAM1 family non-canonical purine NTP pyrophosphatase [Gluconobacter roseus]KXV44732.1 nucleoside-triphosphate diphosphatase [Gluconobacter roseus]GBR43677.1 deoxyribonucleotide triphosphate pyrophosphatase [Gluconobacter roseus NBRC 3990]GEB04968.1 non-canonical purine NTP pyrophosphatase [Gluconobacter roseus NBRC 3990]GLP94486.1 non-canonical purine NTP pyrophosphatase [Gluconobacter roseus NBRC 3990]
MRKLSPGSKIVLASHNAGKLREFSTLLARSGIIVLSAAELDLAEPEETEETFTGNAAIKALAAARVSGLPALADDSGFCVSALDNRPGVYSARWGGPTKDMQVAMERVHREMGDNPDHRAFFVAALCLAWPDGQTRTVQGECHGTVVWPPRGDRGHGYDPIFMPEGESRTFAEMTEAEKNAVSHRGRALEQFLKDFIEA